MNASEKPSTKSQGDHLPWYLKENNHILQDKEDSIDSTGNSYILQYTGNFGKETFNDPPPQSQPLMEGLPVDVDRQVPSPCTQNACHDDTISNQHCFLDTHTHSLKHKHKRRKKRTRFEFEHDDTFAPFTGSVDDLVHKSKLFHHHHQTNNDVPVHVRFLARIRHHFSVEIHGWYISVVVGAAAIYMMLLLAFVAKRHFLRKSSRDASASTSIGNGAGLEITGDTITTIPEETSTSSRCIRVQQKHYYKGETKDGINNHASEEQGTCTQLIQRNDRDNLAELFSTEIPAMAEVIARTGLNRQDSIRIATQEVLAAQRRAVEDARKAEALQLERMRKKVDDALDSLRKSIISTAIGRNLIVCIGMGCATRVLMSNQSLLKRLWTGPESGNYFEIFYTYFLRDICGCLDVYCGEDPSADILASEISLGMYSLKYVGMTWITSLFYPSSPFIGRCIIKCVGQIMLIGAVHKILRVFRSNFLHQLLNIFIILLFALRTELGRSMIRLMIEICGFNAMCSSVTYYGMFYFHLFHHRDLDHPPCMIQSSPSMLKEQIKDLHRKLVKTETMTRDLFIISSAGTLILGCLSSLSNHV